MSARTFIDYGSWRSAACLRGGDGICDGVVDDEDAGHGQDCACPCHTHVIPETVAGVTHWHRNYWSEVG